jgi:hypothetical protein
MVLRTHPLLGRDLRLIMFKQIDTTLCYSDKDWAGPFGGKVHIDYRNKKFEQYNFYVGNEIFNDKGQREFEDCLKYLHDQTDDSNLIYYTFNFLSGDIQRKATQILYTLYPPSDIESLNNTLVEIRSYVPVWNNKSVGQKYNTFYSRFTIYDNDKLYYPIFDQMFVVDEYRYQLEISISTDEICSYYTEDLELALSIYYTLTDDTLTYHDALFLVSDQLKLCAKSPKLNFP